jgi:hypothetical protein
VELPTREDETKDLVAFHLNVTLPDREIETGYGTRWPDQPQGLTHYISLAQKAGFIARGQSKNGRVFHLELHKP